MRERGTPLRKVCVSKQDLQVAACHDAFYDQRLLVFYMLYTMFRFFRSS
jgi:hypothetical protein